MNRNNTGRGSRRFFAVASLGRARWYWVVWPSLEELQASNEPRSLVAEGYEKTKAEAVEKALDAAGMYAKWIAGKYARAYHQKVKAGTTRPGVVPRAGELPDRLVMREFLYRDVYDPVAKQRISVPYRVVRRTEKYVYVEQTPYSAGDQAGDWPDADQLTYRLDRQALERNGYAYIPATAHLPDQEEPVFFSEERVHSMGDQLPACLKILHLAWPCTVTEVQEAYRRLVKTTHPDGGGSHDQFLELQAAYEQALRLFR